MKEFNPHAFPNGRETCIYGMSLEDYYIGQALAGMMANPNLSPDTTDKTIAREARIIARAVLEVRHNG